MFCGFLSNHIDIAPNYAGTLMAITNTAATIGGIFVPIFVGAVTHGNVRHSIGRLPNDFSRFYSEFIFQQTIEAWRTIFSVTIALYVIEILVYTSCGSGDEQPWNKVEEISEDFEEGTPLKGREGERDERNSYTVNK